MTSANVSNLFSKTNLSITQPQKKQGDDQSADFMHVMTKSVSSQQNHVNTTTKDANKASDTSNDASSTDNANVSKDSSYVKDISSNKIKQQKDDLTSDDLDKVKETMDDFSKSVNQTLSEELDVSQEDISDAMNQLGLTYADLLNPLQLSQLVGTLSKESDSVSLLLSGSVSNIMDAITPLTQNVLETTGLSVNQLQQLSDANIVPTEEMTNSLPEGFTAVMPEEKVDVTSITEQPLNDMDLTKNDTALTGDVKDTTTILQNNNSLNSISEQPLQDSLIHPNEIKNTPLTEEVTDENVDSNVNLDISKDAENVPTTKVDGLNVDNHEPQSVATDEMNDTISVTSQENDDTSSQSNSNETADSSLMNQKQQHQQNVNFNENVVSTPTTQTFATKLENAVPVTSQPVSYQTISTSDVIEQIVTRAKTVITDTTQTMEMELNPHSLGKMFMRVTEQEGNVTAKIYIQNEALKDALTQQMASLKESLSAQGIRVEAVEVSVGTHEFERNLESGQNQFQQSTEDTGNSSKENSSRTRNINLNEMIEFF